MLYLHCGWPRTGTSPLQAALAAHDAQLRSSGVLYPDRWRREKLRSHHGLNELIGDSPAAAGARDEFKRFPEARPEGDVILSAEGITGWVRSDDSLGHFAGLLAAAREVMPARCVWTLRRYDEFLESMYRFLLVVGSKLPPPGEWLEDAGDQDALFKGMRRVQEASGGDAVYVRYEAGGAHNGELLDVLGVPDPPAATIRRGLLRSSDPGSSLSHKEAVAFAHVGELSARAGVDLSRLVLRRAFRWEGFRFEEDPYRDLVDGEVKGRVHGRALAAARAHGIEDYARFFGDEETGGGACTGLDAGQITDADLNRLAAHLRLADCPPAHR